MPPHPQPDQRFPVRLTQAQWKVVAGMFPEFSDRLNLDEKNQRVILFTVNELADIRDKARVMMPQATTVMARNSLRHVADFTALALERFQGLERIPASVRVYQFKVSLKDSHPPIWRRIQVKNCTLDKLHEHIQTAMGWTNSHLHHFRIGGQLYGDPMLMEEDFEPMGYQDSTVTKISQILPLSGKRFHFEYEYDFGDSWCHDVLFEGCLRAERGKRYPLCVEGARACPPEDVGGTGSYEIFLEAMANPDHERHREFREWSGDQFDPEAFDPAAATREMHRGLPDWRSEMWI